MRFVLLAAIRGYQRYVSPYKGFRCAYRCHTGRASCSALGYRAVRRHGVLGGLALIRERTYRCGVAHRRHQCAPVASLHSQRGVCDVGCDAPCDAGCDLSGALDVCNLSGALDVCDLLSCCDCAGCDWPQRQRKRRDDGYVHIPPNVKLRV
ncbi:MAG TPA: membrane protein insertion efficiency factor YidD [Burkholderiaceae bacterium]|jgi:putative component of membrane protein insertase Oxa1/YidC/SpoIIIJ protein YidD|nr:membrane protein insertion efficiency factor YidD [Burkholderiaceae bacterium]